MGTGPHWRYRPDSPVRARPRLRRASDPLAAGAPGAAGRAGQRGGAREAPRVVEGDVPDRRGLLLHPVLPARHRRAGRRRAVAAGDAADRGADAARACCRCTGGWPRRARTGRARWRCWRTCCRSGGARSSCWSCSGFVATSWIITITLSAADATVHLLENPLRCRTFLHGQAVADHGRAAADPRRGVPARLQRGRRRRHPAGRGVPRPQRGRSSSSAWSRSSPTPGALVGWTDALTADGGGFGDIVGPAVLAFPLLVLGLSGFETGVSMMPLVAADGADRRAAAAQRGSATPASCSPPPR